MDSQHAMIFGHAAVLSPHEINLKPPCKEDQWAATGASEWHRVRKREGDPDDELSFTEILKIVMNEPMLARERLSLDPFGGFIVLHGLICISWHLQQRAYFVAPGTWSFGSGLTVGTTTASGSRSASPTPRSQRDRDYTWKLAMERALATWRKNTTHGAYTANPSTAKFNRSSSALFRIANITLYTSILDMQILAGMPKLMGKWVKDETSFLAVVRLTHWATSDGAVKAVSHALKLLNETVFSKPTPDYLSARLSRGTDNNYGSLSHRTDYALDGLLHGKWCLYLATLTLWSWGTVTGNSSSREASVSTNGMTSFGGGLKLDDLDGYNNYPDNDLATAWNHAQYYLKTMAAAGDKNTLASSPVRTETRGLIIAMRAILQNERWELCTFRENVADDSA
jgi:Fungal specific transcription factor domain